MSNFHTPILSQYLASFEMLKQAVLQCPEALWNDPGDRNQFWHISYHALFYTHLYAQEKREKFTAWAQHRPHYEQLGPHPKTSPGKPQIGEPYTKAEILAYLEDCVQDIKEKIPSLDLESQASGFSWLPFSKLELQIYNIRHLQHHTAELMERLGERAKIDIEWVGIK
jgi:hypothetical protein